MPTASWLRPVSSEAPVGEQSDVVRKLAGRRPPGGPCSVVAAVAAPFVEDGPCRDHRLVSHPHRRRPGQSIGVERQQAVLAESFDDGCMATMSTESEVTSRAATRRRLTVGGSARRRFQRSPDRILSRRPNRPVTTNCSGLGSCGSRSRRFGRFGCHRVPIDGWGQRGRSEHGTRSSGRIRNSFDRGRQRARRASVSIGHGVGPRRGTRR